MAEIIDFLEYKKRKEEEEIEELRRQLDEVLVFPPEPLPYYVFSKQDEPYYTTYDSFHCWPSPHYEKGSYGRSTLYDEREYLFSELWPTVDGGETNEWE